MRIVGLFHGDSQLIVVASVVPDIVEPDANQLVLFRYDLDKNTLSENRFTMDFQFISGAVLHDNLLVVATGGGENENAHAFDIGTSVSYLGAFPVDVSESDSASNKVFDFQLINGLLYHTCLVVDNPVRQPDGITWQYKDGTPVLFTNDRNTPIRQLIRTTVYDMQGNILYLGYVDPGLNRDRAYRQPSGNQTSPEREMLHLRIEASVSKD